LHQDTYTPIFTAAGSALGVDGFIVGIWWRTGNHIHGCADLKISGVGSAIAGASWRISLPFNADLSLHTTGVLSTASSIIGNFQTHSSVSGDCLSGAVLLSAAAEMIFYYTGSSASIGAPKFTGAIAGVKAFFSYVADPALF
jgi:hypothetical protein